MINKLTKEQESRFPEFVDKWKKIGLCTDRIDVNTAHLVSDFYYEKVIKAKKVPVIIMPSPLSVWYATCMLINREQVWGQVREQVEAKVWEQVKEQVEDSVVDSVRAQVRAQVGEQVRAQVWEQVGEQVEAQIGDFIRPWIDGHLWASLFSFYNFFEEVVGIKYKVGEKYHWFKKTAEIGLFYPLENFCVICDRPSKISIGRNGLHCDLAPSVEYTDRFAVYSLNGIRMKMEYVMTPASEISIETILTEQNIDIRRELIRKVGLTKLIEKGKIIEKENGYTLIDMSPILISTDYAPYLLMQNPSLEETFHLEGVDPECRTIQEAINWRAGNISIQWTPAMLS